MCKGFLWLLNNLVIGYDFILFYKFGNYIVLLYLGDEVCEV